MENIFRTLPIRQRCPINDHKFNLFVSTININHFAFLFTYVFVSTSRIVTTSIVLTRILESYHNLGNDDELCVQKFLLHPLDFYQMIDP